MVSSIQMESLGDEVFGIVSSIQIEGLDIEKSMGGCYYGMVYI